MIVVEYKRHLVNGVLVDPEWVKDGGYFPVEGTWIGLVESEEDRKYYIPGSLVHISTVNELKIRLAKDIFSELVDPKDPNSGVVEVSSDKIAYDWWNSKT